jgi:hypothetical protein
MGGHKKAPPDKSTILLYFPTSKTIFSIPYKLSGLGIVLQQQEMDLDGEGEASV